jgi:hypothetical protein
MRKAVILAVSTTAAVGIVAAAAVGSAAAAPAHRSHHRGPSFTVVERAVTDTTADTGPTGDSLGDVLAFANPVYNAANTTKVGSDNGSCIRTVVGGAYECTWTTTLPGGSLVVTGPFYDTKDSVLAITGGTGKYERARGQMRLHARDVKGSAYDFVFSIG